MGLEMASLLRPSPLSAWQAKAHPVLGSIGAEWPAKGENRWLTIRIPIFVCMVQSVPENRSRASVEYVEKAGLQRHSLWSSAVIDVFLGNFVGYALLTHAEDVLEWISTIAIQFTDDVLVTGCVWLMGVPAGFKLNTELAGAFGIISLNAIQIWTTLWFSASYVFSYVIKAYSPLRAIVMPYSNTFISFIPFFLCVGFRSPEILKQVYLVSLDIYASISSYFNLALSDFFIYL
ncbi:N-acetylglucosaminyl-phosphatidylinositol biosynthetic protein gpi1 [Bienertia sinuspersici]